MAGQQPPPVPPPIPPPGGSPPGEGGAGDPPGEGSAARGGSGRKPFLLRVSPDVMEELRSWAGQELRSLNAHIEFLLREAVKQRKADAARRKESR